MNDTTLTALQVVVERAVRPVRAGARRKDRMREELLAHLAGIYDQERARLGDERAAREEAVRRFGPPADLTRGLQETLTREDRLTYRVERWLGWRAKEPAARHTLRLAVTALALLGAFALATVAFWLTERLLKQRGIGPLPRMLLIEASWLAIVTGAVFLLGWLYFKMRDALCGGPGATRSPPRAAAYGAVISLIALASVSAMLLAFGALLFPAGGLLSLEALGPWWYVLALFALASGPLAALYARTHGPTEIRHAEWACLDIRE
jgi:hypothetical protein